MCGQIAYDWKTIPSPRRLAGTFTRFFPVPPAANNTLPPTDTTPESGCSRPAIDRNVVDLPQPDGPSRVNNSPGSTLKLMLLTANTRAGWPFPSPLPFPDV